MVKTHGGLDHHVTSTLQIHNLAVYEMPEIPDLVAYEKHGLRIVFSFPSYSQHSATINLHAYNLTNTPMQDFLFQVIILWIMNHIL